MKRSLLPVFFLCVCSCPAYSQVVAPVQSQLRVFSIPGSAEVRYQAADQVAYIQMAAGAADASAAAEPATADTSDAERTKQRSEVLKKLTFDRRPSSILKAWSTPPQEEEQEESKEEDGSTTDKPKETPADTADQTDGADKPKELTEEEKTAQKKAEEAKAKAEALAKEIKQLKADVAAMKRNVTLALWPDVSDFIASLDEAEQKTVYQSLLQSLAAGPPDQAKTRNGQFIGERNTIRASDVIALAEICPLEKLEDGHISSLARLANDCQAEGQARYILTDQLQDHVAEVGDEQKIDRRIAARILFTAGRIEDAQTFLPAVAEATEQKDLEAVDLLTDVYLRLYQKEQDKALLEESWNAAQFLLGAEKADDKQKQKAMQRCVQLVPLLREALGQQWLNDSFTSTPQQGMEILAGIGGASAKSMKEQANDPDERVKTLQLQQTAVDALLKAAPENAQEWGSTLHLLASNWLREATYSRKYDQSSSRGPTMTRDVYGNYFWSRSSSRSTSRPTGMPQPIQSGDVLDVRPGDQWLEFLEPGYRSQFSIETARLHLRVKEEDEAFPYIEQLAETHKDEATALVKEFLDVWAQNHNPNTQDQRTSIYMFSFGYSRRASGIPLTRSRQVRNLNELAQWSKRIHALPLDDIEDRWIAAAFKQVHSSAEVYKRDDMERVFGDIESMNAESLATLLQTMRTNLAGIWRKPETQKDAKTNRKQKEIEAEVVRGYESADTILVAAVADHPHSWQLQLAKAALAHDRNDYSAELKKSADFAGKRRDAMEQFRTAARTYAAGVQDLRESEYSVEPFQLWFYAALGATDLDQIRKDRLPVLKEVPLIQAALEELPAETRDKHMAMFANDLFTRMSRVNPGVKFRYVRAGLSIVGDHEQAREAKKVYDYYNDLVDEIKLEAVLDGSPAVGHDQAFGIYVNLRHTKAIERESGGFAKYLQNQNAGYGFSFNYGRPTENYREKFETYTRDALDEHFEVLSVTYQPESVASRATAAPGWRTTSYAYVLVKPRGPEIDRVPPLKIDLDFLDTTGYVVLPLESQALLVDCTTPAPDARPFEKMSVTQTLDERQADEDKLVLEVKATCQGLVPELSDLLDLKFADFKVDSVEDNGVSVSRFDPENNQPVVVSDRLWTLTLKDKSDAAKDTKHFLFASAKVPLHEELWQRYDDADLVEVEQSVTLTEAYDEPQTATSPYIVIGVLLLTLIGAGIWFARHKPSAESPTERFVVPEHATPFNVLSLLKTIESNNGLSSESRQELATSINRIERFYFADETADHKSPDLAELAATWVRKAK